MINDALLLESLHGFYRKEYNGSKLVSILSDEKNISLRSIDWFITNYSKKNNTYYIVYQDEDKNPSFDDKDNNYYTNMNVFHSYKSQLKAYSKKKFDPFCRRDRLTFDCNGSPIETTIGQLNFFKWAIDNLIIDYIKDNYDEIEEDMNTCYNSVKVQKKEKKEKNERKRRQELSKSASRGLNSNNMKVVLDFN